MLKMSMYVVGFAFNFFNQRAKNNEQLKVSPKEMLRVSPCLMKQ